MDCPFSASVGYLACSTTKMQANCNPSPFCNGAIAAKDACSHAFRNIFTCCFIIAGFLLDEESQILVGFIQVTGLKFYRDLCLHGQRKGWFTKFRTKGDYKVLT